MLKALNEKLNQLKIGYDEREDLHIVNTPDKPNSVNFFVVVIGQRGIALNRMLMTFIQISHNYCVIHAAFNALLLLKFYILFIFHFILLFGIINSKPQHL